ncbi:hypothetical protein G3I40_20590 [Streptomyces sp. SID14478]|uniref:hypothetical protein n=1 Tax=Streptomyces sp. SID14478 TaxID=2706073 RepID=UPI0013DA4CCF|nr:hypothetical protein [Streptomyces sp. SID14478]NEB77592.1 hypothetical protein [Streptomyces sp. SID14478]
MISEPRLVAAPVSLVSEVSELLAYGLTKNCPASRELHTTLHTLRSDYRGSPAVPLPAELLPRLQRTLLELCISAGTDFPPGEKIVRFTRAADQIRILTHPHSDTGTPDHSPTETA